MVWIIVIVAVIFLDQASKMLIINNIGYSDTVPIINNFFHFTYIYNKGTAFGLFQNGKLLFLPLVLIVSAVVGYVLYKADNKILKISLSFILGGAVGNIIDRIFRGSVVDFLDFRFGSYNFYIFNIADSFVVIGTIILAYYILFIYKEKEKLKV